MEASIPALMKLERIQGSKDETLPLFVVIDNSRLNVGSIDTGILPRKSARIFSIRATVTVSVAGSVVWYYIYPIQIFLHYLHLSVISRSKLLVLNM